MAAPKVDGMLFRGDLEGEPKPAGLERCDESRRARLCWTRALVECRNRRAIQGGHSRHGNEAVDEVETVRRKDRLFQNGRTQRGRGRA